MEISLHKLLDKGIRYRQFTWTLNIYSHDTGYSSGAHEINPPVFGRVRFAKSLVFYVVSLYFICFFVFLLFRHGVVSLFSIYEFDSSSGIFRPSFISIFNNFQDGIKHCFFYKKKYSVTINPERVVRFSL